MKTFEEKKYQPYNDKMVYIVRDEHGNVATGRTREEAYMYLERRRQGN